MDYKNDPVYAEADRLMRAEFAKARAAGKLSEAHDESHVDAVANVAPVVVMALSKAQGFDQMTESGMRIAAITGKMHDIVRGATEKSKHGPVGAEYVRGLRGTAPWDAITERDFDLMRKVIERHEESFPAVLELYGEPIGGSPTVYESMVGNGVIVGDRVVEGSGHRIIERRIRFVGRERMQKDGDLAQAGFIFPEDSPLAVLGESMVRLYEKNSLKDCPRWVVPYAQGLHGTQYLFLAGLLAHFGWTEEQAAQELLKRRFTGFKEELAEKVAAEHHLTGEAFEDDYPDLAKGLRAISSLRGPKKEELAEAAYGLVMELAGPETAEESNHLILSAEMGTSEYRNFFMSGIRAYKMGDPQLLGRLEQSIETEVRKYAATL